MWSIIREILTYLCFVSLICTITYSNHNLNSYYQVKHLQKYFLNSRQINLDYTKVKIFFFLFFYLNNFKINRFQQ